MPLGVHCLPEAICESKGQAGNLPVSYCNTVVRQAVLVHYHIVQRHLANYPSDDVAAAFWSNSIVAISQRTPEE